MIWATKYRPTSLDSFYGQSSIKKEMMNIIRGEAPMQHFIFHSPEPGTGKTTMAYLLAENLGYSLHKYNASSKRQRGIEFVEDDLAPRTRIGQWETIFFLDEADQLTPAAQSALKGVIEDAQGYFILTCNDLSKVSPWLQSRCTVRRFMPVGNDFAGIRLSEIAQSEGIDISDEHLAEMVQAHTGDLRNQINALQAYSSLSSEDRAVFIVNLKTPVLDTARFLRLCFRESAVEDAVLMLDENDLRRQIDAIFRDGVGSKASPSGKLRLVEASTQAHRDLISGVEAHYVKWDFVRRLCG